LHSKHKIMIPTAIVSSEYDNRVRKLYQVSCLQCGKPTYRPKHTLKGNVFCSRHCSSLHRKNRVTTQCAQCGETIARIPSKLSVSKSGLSFCDRKCKELAQHIGGITAVQPDHYATGKTSYRAKALGLHGTICSLCGYGKEIRMLDVHHIDGNRSNNNLSNLEVLCVWCHALKTRMVPYHERG